MHEIQKCSLGSLIQILSNNPLIFEMRRHYANYLKGLPGIKDYRSRLVTLMTVEEIDAVLDEIVTKYAGYEFEKTAIELINYHEKCPIE